MGWVSAGAPGAEAVSEPTRAQVLSARLECPVVPPYTYRTWLVPVLQPHSGRVANMLFGASERITLRFTWVEFKVWGMSCGGYWKYEGKVPQ